VTGSVITGQEAVILDRLHKLPTAAISDALDREGIPGALEGLVPLSDEFRAAGPAFTIRYAPTDSAGGTVGDFLDEVPPGAVIVIDNDGRRDVTVWGGIMTEVAAPCGRPARPSATTTCSRGGHDRGHARAQREHNRSAARRWQSRRTMCHQEMSLPTSS